MLFYIIILLSYAENIILSYYKALIVYYFHVHPAFLSVVFIRYSLNPDNTPLPGHGFITVGLLVLIICYFFFRQLQQKAINITIEDAGIIIKKYVPVGNPKSYLYHSLDGFKTGRIDFHGAHYEILYFIKEGKTIAQISGYMHSNYNEMKVEIEKHLKNLGEVIPPFLDL